MSRVEVITMCPFCPVTPDSTHPETFESCPVTDWGAVVCECGCSGPAVNIKGKTEEQWHKEAMGAWNKRSCLVISGEFGTGKFTIIPNPL